MYRYIPIYLSSQLMKIFFIVFLVQAVVLGASLCVSPGALVQGVFTYVPWKVLRDHKIHIYLEDTIFLVSQFCPKDL